MSAETNDIYEYDEFDRLRESLTTLPSPLVRSVEQRDGSYVLRVESVVENEEQPEQQQVVVTHRLLNLAVTLPLSRSTGSINVNGLDQSKGALLAQYHFNNRKESVVTNLEQLLRNPDGSECDLRMTLDFYDTKFNAGVAVKVLTREIHPRPFPYETGAVVGATLSSVSTPMAIVNTVEQLPQISHGSTSTELDAPGTFDFFGRVVPSNDGDARVAMNYFVNVTQTRHLGIIYVDDEYGTAYRNALERIARREGVITQSFGTIRRSTLTEDSRASLERAAQFLAQTGFRHFIGVLFSAEFEYLLEVGAQIGIMGPGRFWLFGAGLSSPFVEQLRYPMGSPQASALHGSGIVRVGASLADGSYVRFLDAFREEEENGQFLQYWATKSPLATDAVTFDANYTSGTPHDFSQLAYDAVMALGIAGCSSNETFFTGTQLYQRFTASNFTGASGDIEVNERTGSRIYTSASYIIQNIRVVPDEQESGMVTTSLVVAAEFERQTNGEGQVVSQWINPEGVVYMYSDSSASPPPPLPPREIDDILGAGYGIFVSLACFMMLSSIWFAAWTIMHRKSHVIQASQPSFLLVICLGEFLLAMVVVMNGATSPPHTTEWAQLSCMPAIWVAGFGVSIVFSALFAKTWRINKILGGASHFRRVTVTIQDAALPGVFLVIGSLLVLAAWQIADPLRYQLSFNEFGSVDRFGRPIDVVAVCSSENGWGIYFAGALLAITGVTLIAANYQAYKARHLTTEYSESAYIAGSMAISLQGIILAVPIFSFEHDAQASFVARSAVLLVVTSSSLFLIFVPKVYYHWDYLKKAKARAQRKAKRKGEVALWERQNHPGGEKNNIPTPTARSSVGVNTEMEKKDAIANETMNIDELENPGTGTDPDEHTNVDDADDVRGSKIIMDSQLSLVQELLKSGHNGRFGSMKLKNRASFGGLIKSENYNSGRSASENVISDGIVRSLREPPVGEQRTHLSPSRIEEAIVESTESNVDNDNSTEIQQTITAQASHSGEMI